jgi:hypothetical protein
MGGRNGKHRLVTAAYIPESLKVRIEEKRGNVTVIKTEYHQRKQKKRVSKGKPRATKTTFGK